MTFRINFAGGSDKGHSDYVDSVAFSPDGMAAGLPINGFLPTETGEERKKTDELHRRARNPTAMLVGNEK